MPPIRLTPSAVPTHTSQDRYSATDPIRFDVIPSCLLKTVKGWSDRRANPPSPVPTKRLPAVLEHAAHDIAQKPLAAGSASESSKLSTNTGPFYDMLLDATETRANPSALALVQHPPFPREPHDHLKAAQGSLPRHTSPEKLVSRLHVHPIEEYYCVASIVAQLKGGRLPTFQKTMRQTSYPQTGIYCGGAAAV